MIFSNFCIYKIYLLETYICFLNFHWIELKTMKIGDQSAVFERKKVMQNWNFFFDIGYRWKFALVKELQVKAIGNDCYGQWIIIISLSWYKCFKLFYVNCSSKLGGNSFRNQNLLSKQSKLVNKMSGICSWRILQKRLKHLS